MVAGEARRRAELVPGTRYLPLDKKGREKAPEPIWEGNPHIAKPGEPHDGTIGYVNGLRAYIESATQSQWTWREYEPHPAFIALPQRARELATRAAGAVVFNPTIKPGATPNKDWGINRWRSLIAGNLGIRWLQIGDFGPTISGAERIRTADIFDAFGLLSGARAVVCHEGALHHAAAALNVPAIVLRGGFISWRVTGYAGQADLYVADERYPLGCGMRIPCAHCAEAMATITPEDVMTELALLPEVVAA